MRSLFAITAADCRSHFDLFSPPGLGMRIVKSFATQLNARLDVRRLDPGTEFVLTAPMIRTQ